jgi:cellulose synthase/poly-beta-1,6-N-acetylglucosamine synthase-like glycosyltransferase
MEYLVYILILYLILHLLLRIGIHAHPSISDQQPSVSICVAARNEEKHILTLLKSLVKLTYPKSLLEVIIVNDNSTDKTLPYIEIYSRKNEIISVLNITDSYEGLTGKMNALAQGIRKAKGEIILVTDADCLVPPDWVEQYVANFTPDTGMVGGLTLLTPRGFWGIVQFLDWLFLQAIAAGATAIGLPITILGNNFAFRKKVYEEVGGFVSIGFSVTEDMALLKAISRKTAWRIKYVLHRQTAIQSEPVPSVKAFYNQRKRWIIGGRRVSWWGYLLMVTAFLTHLIMVAIWPLKLLSTAAIVLVLLCILADFFLLFTILCRIGQKRYALFFPIFELFYILYTLGFSFLFILPSRVDWKGRQLK